MKTLDEILKVVFGLAWITYGIMSGFMPSRYLDNWFVMLFCFAIYTWVAMKK